MSAARLAYGGKTPFQVEVEGTNCCSIEPSQNGRHRLGREFGGKVRSWCTFNEPGVYTFSGYCMGGFPPAKAMHLRTAGRVLKHMLIAHTDAYRLIKGMPGARL